VALRQKNDAFSHRESIRPEKVFQTQPEAVFRTGGARHERRVFSTMRTDAPDRLDLVSRRASALVRTTHRPLFQHLQRRELPAKID
jgi:hypothetical protein